MSFTMKLLLLLALTYVVIHDGGGIPTRHDDGSPIVNEDTQSGEDTKNGITKDKKGIDHSHDHKHVEEIIQEVEAELEVVRDLEKDGKVDPKDEDAALRELFKHTPIDLLPKDAEDNLLHDTPNTRRKREIYHKVKELHRAKRGLNNYPYYMWEKGIIPYTITPIHTEDQIVLYKQAMSRWEFNTCIRFVEDTPTIHADLGITQHTNHLNFVNISECWSFVGNLHKTSGQDISCCGKWACIHELGHTLGFGHEQRNARGLDYIWIYDTEWGDTYTSPRWDTWRYDATSIMHYYPSSAGLYMLDHKQAYHIQWSEDYFTMWSALSDTYGCQEIACPSMAGVKCENDGYITPLGGECQCVCPKGLGSDSRCADVYQGDQSLKQLAWPGGSYALSKTEDSCGSATMTTGTMTQTSSADVSTETGHATFAVRGSIDGPTLTQEFCVQDNVADTGTKWSSGVFCIHRVGGACPSDFKEGSIEFTDAKGATVTGNTPDADITNSKTIMRYCCRDDGGDEDPMKLPTSSNFAMYASYTDTCQSVKDMQVQSQTYSYTNVDAASVVTSGSTPYFKKSENKITLTLCYYRPIQYGCGAAYYLDALNKKVTFTSPNYGEQYDNNRNCFWFFKGPVNSTMQITFDDFDVDCSDGVEVREYYSGDAGHRYCGKKRAPVNTNHETLTVLFRSDYSKTAKGFKATVELITADDYCYAVKDKGASYRGDISVTRDAERCLHWAERRKCRHHTFHPGDFYDGLSGNECRNPGHGIRPWCYIKTDCSRNYCDVCGKESCEDKEWDCDFDIAANPQHCNTELGQLKCRKKCGYCSDPEPTDCPSDWSPFEGKCYRVFNKKGTFDEAVAFCATVGAKVVSAKTKAEEEHVIRIAEGYSFIWLGLTDRETEGSFVWGDGTEVTYTNWAPPAEPNNAGVGQDCVLLHVTVPDWWDFKCDDLDYFACMMPETGGNCYDIDSSCPAQLQANGNLCENTNSKATCRKTCGLCAQQSFPKVGTLSCPAPEVPSDSNLIGTTKDSYAVGETVEFQCKQHSIIKVKATCTTAGQWTKGGYTCHACLEEWTDFNGYCYRNFEIRGTFAEATTKCAEYGAKITTAKTKEEEDFLVTLKGKADHVWLDFRDDVTEGTWLWGDGSAPTYTNWEKTEPNNYGGQDCALLVFLKVTEWWDQGCELYKYILCKMEIAGDRVICTDKISHCEQIIRAAPDACSTTDEFSEVLCPKSCGVCGSPQACDASVQSSDVILVSELSSVSAGGFAEYKCAEGFEMASGDAKRACLINGQLTGEAPVCKAAAAV